MYLLRDFLKIKIQHEETLFLNIKEEIRKEVRTFRQNFGLEVRRK